MSTRKKSDPTIKATEMDGMAIGNVESMTNNIGNIEQVNNHFYGRQLRPVNKIVPLSTDQGGLSVAQKNYFTDIINKIVELGSIIKNFKAKHGIVRNEINKAGGVTSVNLYPADKFRDGVGVARIWLGPMLTHEKVVQNPPEWWKDHLSKAIYAEVNSQGKDEAFKEWLRVVYSVESLNDLEDQELAEVYTKRKNKFANPKIKENPRDSELRITALMRYFDEMERLGDFDRMNIRMTSEQLLNELQKRDRSLFSIAPDTFYKTVITPAKKISSFKFKTGVRPKSRA